MASRYTQKKERRAEVIAAVQTPLAFYALIALVAEVGFGVAAALNVWPAGITVAGMVLLLLALVAIVAYQAHYSPESLLGRCRPRERENSTTEFLAGLMTCPSKEILTVVRMDMSAVPPRAVIVGANAHANEFYGLRAGATIIGKTYQELCEILTQWIDQDDFTRFLNDQSVLFDKFRRREEIYASVPIIINQAHPVERYRGRRFLPITLAYTSPMLGKKETAEDALVAYLNVDEINQTVR